MVVARSTAVSTVSRVEAAAPRLVGRPHWTLRARSAAVGLPIALIGALVLARGNSWGLLLLPLGLYTSADLWRRVTVTRNRLVAQGRLGRRSVELTHLVALGVSPMARLWVSPRDGRAFYLPMVSDLKGDPDNPDVWTFADLLRDRAVAAGAALEPDSREETRRPPVGTADFFGA